MVLINKAINEVTVKLVYYGPGLCGKTTNLEKIYANPKLDNKGKMISMSTETDRTLFFDFMPMELGTIAGQKVRVQLYTVPGQVFYDATRKLVLRGADGVVFVADSQASMRESNLDSLRNLQTNLRINRIDPDKVALVFQYNKRDLPNVDTVDAMNAYLNPGNHPVVEAVAKEGVGVTATLRAAVTKMLENLKNNVDTTLYEQPELTAPDMTQRAGVTTMSAGTPKLSMKTGAGTTPTPQVAAPSGGAAADSAAGRSATAAAAAPREALPFEPVEEDPFGAVAVAEPEPHDDDNPFGAMAVSPDPGPITAAAVADNPFASAAEIHDVTGEREELETLLANARQVVQSLEAALERARENERMLAEKAARL